MNLLYLLLQSGVSEELKEYWSLFKNTDNPIYSSFIFILIVIIVFYMTIKYILIPLQRKHTAEEDKLRMQNVQLMVLFADMDPEPVLRIDLTGKLIFINPAAKRDGFDMYRGKDFKLIFPNLKLDIIDLIMNNESMTFHTELKEKHYSVQFIGISNLRIAQLYLNDVTQFKLNQEALELAKLESKEFSKNLQNTIEEERKKIARELHDVVGHDLVVLQMVLQKKFFEFTGNENSPEFLECVDMLNTTVKDLKGIAYSLKTGMLDKANLVFTLYSLIETVKKQKGIEGKFEYDLYDEKVNDSVETAIYRIAQEAVNNIIKYSQASEFSIMLKNKGDFIRLVITDNGIGFNIKKQRGGKGMGILNMRERTESYKGFFNITSAEGQGTMVVAEFPMEIKSNGK